MASFHDALTVASPGCNSRWCDMQDGTVDSTGSTDIPSSESDRHSESSSTYGSAEFHSSVDLLEYEAESLLDMNANVMTSLEMPPPSPHPVSRWSFVDAPSVGSHRHPFMCGDACKYVRKAKGCKDGSDCSYCHRCVWFKPYRASRRVFSVKIGCPSLGQKWDQRSVTANYS